MNSNFRKIVQIFYELIRRNNFLVKNYYSIYIYILRIKLSKQLARKNDDYIKSDYFGKVILVPIIETNHYQHYQILILAKALQQRGADVKIIICGESLPGCEIKSIKNNSDPDPCFVCRLNVDKILPLFKMEVIKLSQLVDQEQIKNSNGIELETFGNNRRPIKDVESGIRIDGAIVDSVVRYYYGGMPDQNESSVFGDHLQTALIALAAAKKLHRSVPIDLVLSNMNVYSAWEPIYKYFESRGIRTATISITPFDFNSVRYNLSELFKSNQRYKNYKRARNNTYLTKQEKKILLEFIRDRFSGRSEIFRTLDCYSTRAPIDAEIKKEGRRRVFLFPNLAWDVGLSDQGGLYKDVIEWVFKSVDLVKNRDDVCLFIKPHPAEVFGSSSTRKGVISHLYERFPILPTNVIIIDPKKKIKPYDLFSYIDLGVIFSGTLGLEMMLAGIPVVSTGKTSHMGLQFAAEPNTEAEYRALLFGDLECPKYDRRELELFAYFYFVRTLIPWNLTKQSYADRFNGFQIESLDDIQPGSNHLLDFLCNSIIDPEKIIPECWPSTSKFSS